MADTKLTAIDEKTAPIGEDLVYIVSDPTGTPIEKRSKLTNLISKPINTATDKATPVDADSIGLVDSASSSILKKLSWANIKATLKSYLDTLYAPIATKTEVDAARDGESTLLAQIDALQAAIVTLIPISSTYTLTCTPGTAGSITLSSSADTLVYYQTGKLIHVQGRVDVLSVSSPLGVMEFNLPSAAAGLLEGQDNTVGTVKCIGLSGIDDSQSIQTYIFATYDPNLLRLSIDNPISSMSFLDASNVIPGSSFYFNFSYIAA